MMQEWRGVMKQMTANPYFPMKTMMSVGMLELIKGLLYVGKCSNTELDIILFGDIILHINGSYCYAEPWLQYEPLICILISPNEILSSYILLHLPTHNKPLISSNTPTDIIVFIGKYGLAVICFINPRHSCIISGNVLNHGA